MKISNFAKNNQATALVAVLALFLIVLGCSAEKPSAPPTEADAQTLVKTTTSEFADAVDKGDFTAFRANTSKELQTQTTNDQMKAAFKPYLDEKAAVVPLLRDAAKKTPKFSPAFAVREESGYSVLTTVGTIDSDPQPIKFKNEYVYQDGKWKLLKVEFDLN